VSVASNNQSTAADTLTLGELLYADAAITFVSEKAWLALVHAIAAGNQLALRELFEKTYPVVFTYLIRLTGNPQLTEEVILDVFQDIWCEAPVFDAANGPVIGWIMGKARTSALDHAQSASRPRSGVDHTDIDLPRAPIPPAVAQSAMPENLREAIGALTQDEREAIEATFGGLSYAEVAARQAQSVGTIKGRIRSGLAKLHQSLQERGTES